MARTWYPVIDYTLCTECGSCIAKCSHGVYDKAKAPVPVVQVPEACFDHCHGCGNLCPAGAITYLGEDTGWVPPCGVPIADESECGCGSGDAMGDMDNVGGSAAQNSASAENSPKENTVSIDYLYLDLSSCDRCIGTDQVLEEVVASITPALALAGHAVAYQRTEMANAEIATRYRFLSSPTIRVNGRDIATHVSENHCGCCSAISDSDVDCRVFEYAGKTYEVPPKQMLAEGILRAVFGSEIPKQEQASYQLSENLKEFYTGKENKKCECGGNCNP